MVERQIEARGIRDGRVLDAFRRVPRHRFVSDADVDRAHDDHPLSIGLGQTISQPYMVASMTQELQLSGGERVLEIGTGSGYQTAILAELAAEVFTVERLEVLSRRAEQTLDELGYTNIHFRVGDGTLGWPDEAPFDRIIVAAGAPKVPGPLKEQLADGGRLVIPVGGVGMQQLMIVRRQGEQLTEAVAGSCVFVKLIGQEAWPGA